MTEMAEGVREERTLRASPSVPSDLRIYGTGGDRAVIRGTIGPRRCHDRGPLPCSTLTKKFFVPDHCRGFTPAIKRESWKPIAWQELSVGDHPLPHPPTPPQRQVDRPDAQRTSQYPQPDSQPRYHLSSLIVHFYIGACPGQGCRLGSRDCCSGRRFWGRGGSRSWGGGGYGGRRGGSCRRG